MLNCHRVAITSLALLFLYGTVDGKQSIRHIRKLERKERDLAPLWVQPAYWEPYNELFTVKRLKKCKLKKGVPPDNGSYCATLATGWYTCFFGGKNCAASPDALPGLGNYVGVSLGTSQVHPSMRCDCVSGKWTCYDWDICTKPQSCGSRGLPPCPDGQMCIDPDPTDSCDPAADCPGICAPSPTTPIMTDPVEDPPSPMNNAFCPATVPESGNKCPAYLPGTAICEYGTVRCCNDPGIPKTTCSCKNGIFECTTVAIKCASCTPSPTIPASVCPKEAPTASQLTCSQKLRCTYGTEACCGKVFDSLICECTVGKQFRCRTTEACFRPTCDPPVACSITKQEWPELVGTLGTDAKVVIEKEEPCLKQVAVILKGQPITKDMIQDRVRIFVDESGIVMAIPRVG